MTAAAKDTSVPNDIIESVTPHALAALLQGMGYRGEVVTIGEVELVRSATSGLPFELRLGNRLASKPNSAVDIVLLAALKVEGDDFPLDLLNRWNIEKRFGRLFLNQGFLLASLDVVIGGGIRIANFRAHIELWDQLLQDLVPFLRGSFAERASPATPPAAHDKPSESINSSQASA